MYRGYHLSACRLQCPLSPANKGVGKRPSSIEVKSQRGIVQILALVKLQSKSAASDEAFGFSWQEIRAYEVSATWPG